MGGEKTKLKKTSIINTQRTTQITKWYNGRYQIDFVNRNYKKKKNNNNFSYDNLWGRR